MKIAIWTEFRYYSLETGRVMNHPDDLMLCLRTIAPEDCLPTKAKGFAARVDEFRAHARQTATARQDAINRKPML